MGHVNKDGAIAGPKVMEHIVDCVLYFEGDRHTSYRMLRCVKNRYGSTNEIGVFEMRDKGLAEVENPSLMMLSGRLTNVSGTCVACAMEGSRPLLAEVQGLVSPTGFGNPRRMSTGFDNNRLNLLLAVLEKRAGYFFSNLDAYINVVGGLRLDEPATVCRCPVPGVRPQGHAGGGGDPGLRRGGPGRRGAVGLQRRGPRRGAARPGLHQGHPALS